jgi:hypothetical protein
MTLSNTPVNYEDWQGLYSPIENRWKDLAKTTIFILPIVFLLLVVISYILADYTLTSLSVDPALSPEQFPFQVHLPWIVSLVLPPIMIFITGLTFIFGRARAFVNSLYRPAENEKLMPLIGRKLFGLPPLPPILDTFIKYPFVIINQPTVEKNHWIRWFGGPATLVVYDGFAVYLERGNKFSRVVGPGMPMPFLEPFEKVKEIVDLRPQTRIGYVHPWTKDGIRIKLTIRADCQINAKTDPLERPAKFRYPFDPLAVKAAVEHMTVKIDAEGRVKEQSWLDGAWGTISGLVNAYVAGRSLDELFIAPNLEKPTEANHANDNHTTESIEQILSRKFAEDELPKIRLGLIPYGVKVLNIQITKIEVPEPVNGLRTRYWESIRKKIAAQRDSHAEAERIRARELAHAEAQRTMLMTIIKRLENTDPENLTEPLILSLSGILDQNLDDPIVRPLIAKEAFAVLERMRKILKVGF